MRTRRALGRRRRCRCCCAPTQLGPPLCYSGCVHPHFGHVKQVGSLHLVSGRGGGVSQHRDLGGGGRWGGGGSGVRVERGGVHASRVLSPHWQPTLAAPAAAVERDTHLGVVQAHGVIGSGSDAVWCLHAAHHDARDAQPPQRRVQACAHKSAEPLLHHHKLLGAGGQRGDQRRAWAVGVGGRWGRGVVACMRAACLALAAPRASSSAPRPPRVPWVHAPPPPFSNK